MAALLEPPVAELGPRKVFFGSGPPVNASDCVGCVFGVGDIILNDAPGTNGPLSWICTAASTAVGNPGTWMSAGDGIGGSAANAAFGNSNRRLAHAQYSFANDGGTAGLITPKNNALLPINSVITNAWFNSTTAPVGTGATLAFGTSAGSSAASLLAALAITSFTLNAFVAGIPTPQTKSTFVKLSAAGSITMTIATANLTAGIIECYLEFYVSST